MFEVFCLVLELTEACLPHFALWEPDSRAPGLRWSRGPYRMAQLPLGVSLSDDGRSLIAVRPADRTFIIQAG